MREIKFRAVVENKLYHVVNIGFNSSGITDITLVDSYDGDWSERTVKYPLDMVKLLHFTGFKDKNGKEIYEGDLIEIKGQNYRYIAEIIWEETCGAFDIVSKGLPDYLHSMMELFVDRINQIKVIGNIYENPELL